MGSLIHRNAVVNLAASEELIEGVINPATLRKSENLPESAKVALTIMEPWASPGFWRVMCMWLDLSTNSPTLAVLLPCLALTLAPSPWPPHPGQQHPHPHTSTTFMLLSAIDKKRPLAVFERNGSSYRNPARIYGEYLHRVFKPSTSSALHLPLLSSPLSSHRLRV